MTDQGANEKAYYRIGEVASMLNVNASSVRFWERELAIKTRKTASGKRRYTPDDIAQLRMAHHLIKDKGYTLKGAKIALNQAQGKVKNKVDLIAELKEIRLFLKHLKDALLNPNT